MASLRFPTPRDLYDAFPTAADDVGAPPSDEPSLAFLQALTEDAAWDAALSFCAYLLPRREAVAWGSHALRRMQPVLTQLEIQALDAAEAWARDPEEERRREALRTGMRGDVRTASVWMALAAGWSGGNMMPPDLPAKPPAPHQTARAVRAGLLIAKSQLPQDVMPEAIQACLASGIKLATTGL